MKNVEILFFYNRKNPESIRIKASFYEEFYKNSTEHSFDVTDIDVLRHPNLCSKYEVYGVPTILIVKNEIPVFKHLGDIRKEEIKIIFEALFNTKSIE